MVGPGLYTEIGKKTRDLLYKDYQTDHKFSLATYTANGVALTATSTKKADLIFGEIQSQIKNKNITVDVKANSDSNVITTVTVDDIAAPRLSTILSFAVPDQRSGKLELKYMLEYAGINASFGLTANPIVNFAGAFGTKGLAVGADLSFDTATGNFTKYNAGLNFAHEDLIASLNLNNKGDSLTAAYYHSVRQSTSTAVGAELTHSFSTKENTITFGTHHALDPLTTVKARFNSFGKFSALVQHEWRTKTLVTISAEVDTKTIEKSAKVGVAVALKP